MVVFGGYVVVGYLALFTGCVLAGGGVCFLAAETKAAGISTETRQSTGQWLYAKIAVIVGKYNFRGKKGRHCKGAAFPALK